MPTLSTYLVRTQAKCDGGERALTSLFSPSLHDIATFVKLFFLSPFPPPASRLHSTHRISPLFCQRRKTIISVIARFEQRAYVEE